MAPEVCRLLLVCSSYQPENRCMNIFFLKKVVCTCVVLCFHVTMCTETFPYPPLWNVQLVIDWGRLVLLPTGPNNIMYVPIQHYSRSYLPNTVLSVHIGTFSMWILLIRIACLPGNKPQALWSPGRCLQLCCRALGAGHVKGKSWCRVQLWLYSYMSIHITLFNLCCKHVDSIRKSDTPASCTWSEAGNFTMTPTWAVS
jgi:hypothetical protein